MSFQAKHIFVAGGTSGINLGIALAFAKKGAHVTVMSRSQDNVNNAVEFLSEHSQAQGFACDVRNVESLKIAFQHAVDKFGAIHCLVSGAAGNFPCKADALSENGFSSIIDIDLKGSFNVAKAAFPHMAKPASSLIHISAPQAVLPMKQQIHVCAAKAGVDMLTKVLALEWAEHGIRVNSIMPGPIANTEGMDRLAPTEHIQKIVANSVPLKKLGQKEDIANAALFLASDAANYIHGVVLPVDGGWSLGGASTLLQ